jgi:UDP-2,3-diacylglucosamine hydrolase
MLYNKVMKTIFIADTHLSTTNPATVNIFLNFLSEYVNQVDALYILGDLFDFWIGDDHQTTFNTSIIEALKAFTQHTPIYLIPGNRDFLLGRRFAKETGCHLLKDPTVIKLYGTPVLITHGDLFCTHDIYYKIFRKIIRNRLLLRLFFLNRSLLTRELKALQYRIHSQKINALKDPVLLAISKKLVIKMMKKYRVNYLIHGHTHHPSMEYFQHLTKNKLRIELGAWYTHGSLLICQPNLNKNTPSVDKPLGELSFQLTSFL